MRLAFIRTISLVSLVLALIILPHPARAASCQFVLGFQTLHDLIPTVVGDCLVDEHHNPQNGDGLQETTGPSGAGGLLVWRKCDNWTAYTDGYHTWINGPVGLQQRLNTQRFPWEHACPPATGIITQQSRFLDGLGELTIDNSQGQLDAVAVLLGSGNSVAASAYIRKGDRFTLQHIHDGSYPVFFTLGVDWDAGRGRFTSQASYQRFTAPLLFQTTSSSGGSQYTTFTVTLYGVIGGTGRTQEVDEGQFPVPRQ